MLRSLPAVSRLVPAVLIALITATLLFKSLAYHRWHCDNGQCSIDDDKEPEDTRPLTRAEFRALEQKLRELQDDIQHLKHEPIQKQLTPEEQVWESRRTQCGEGVVRNIDYQHVSSIPTSIIASSSLRLTGLPERQS
jgi:hypothetical protein